MKRSHSSRILPAVCGLAALLAATAAAQAPPPKLVVMIVVDQMRPEYLYRHAAELKGGLKRFVEDGAVFDEGAYPYLNTVTCAGHATIGTGAFPYRHGMILNTWYDRDAGASTSCTTDPAEQSFGYGGLEAAGHSAKRLLVPTLADTLRERSGRVVTLSQKARSAINLAGHGGDSILWFDERGTWMTSTAYHAEPVPFVQRFIARNPITKDYGKAWRRSLPASAYEHADDQAQERPPSGWTRRFPHRLGTPGGKPDAAFFAQWARSPFADEYLARMAADAVDALKLGRGEGTDFLGVSFSALDLVGHGFGPRSHEVQDLVLRLDRTIGRLLDHLDRTVGRANYVVGFSSDHGVAGIPEQTEGGGRHTSGDVRDAINGALEPLFGPPPAAPARPGAATPPRPSYMAYSAYTDTYLAPGIMDRLRGNPKALEAVLDALRALPGIEYAFTGDELIRPEARTHADPVKRAAALNYHPARSGDIIIVPKVNWILSTAATTHGTLHPYDQRVPVIFYGAGVAAGHYGGTATPADLAPTLALLARVPFTAVDGKVLPDAVARLRDSGGPGPAERTGALEVIR